MTDIAALNERIQRESAFTDILLTEVGKTIIGQKAMIERLCRPVQRPHPPGRGCRP